MVIAHSKYIFIVVKHVLLIRSGVKSIFLGLSLTKCMVIAHSKYIFIVVKHVLLIKSGVKSTFDSL